MAQLISGATGQNSQQWGEGALASILGLLQSQGTGPGQGIFNTYSGALGPTAANNMQWASTGAQNFVPGLQDALGGYQNQIPGIFQNNQFAQTPQGQAAQQQQFDVVNQLTNPQNIAQQNFSTGGWTPQYQQQYNQLGNFLSGLANNPAQSASNTLLGNTGNTQYTAQMQSNALNGMAGGGYTPTLNVAGAPVEQILNTGGQTQFTNALFNSGQGALAPTNLGVAGLTNTGAQGEQTALGVLQNNGQMPITQNLQGLGLNLASQPSLLTPQEAISFAANQAGTQNANQFKQAYANAVARGGGPGADVANGMSNQAMADFANQSAQNVSNAVQQALVQQQGLQLQQAGMGANMAQSGGNLQNQFLGTASGLLGGLENTAAQRFGLGGQQVGQAGNLSNELLGTGLNMIPALQNSATNVVNTYGNLGNQASGLQNSFLNSAGNIQGMLNSNILGGMNAYNATMGNQNQYDLGMGGLSNSISANQGNLLNEIFGQGISSGNLALGQNQGLTNAMNQGFGNQLNLGSLYGSYINPAYNALGQLAGYGANIWNTGLGGMPGLAGGISNIGQYNPWGEAINATVNTATKAMTGGLG